MIVCLVLAVPSVRAVVPPTPSRTPAQLQALFPGPAQLPAGMVLQESGERTEAEIAGSFADPADAAAILNTSGWAFNAYQLYVAGTGSGPDSIARLEISLHQFAGGRGAAYAMPYFIHGRAVILGRPEVSPFEFGNACAGAVLGDYEATRYQRIGDLLIRVTAVASSELTPSGAYAASVGAANAAIDAIMANAGSSRQLLDQTCQ